MHHPKIEMIGDLIKEYNPPVLLSFDTLRFLKEKGATATEAAITLFSVFGVPDEEAEKFVYESGIWEPENINDIFDQTLIYLFYDPNSESYKVNKRKIRIPIIKKSKNK